VFFFFFNPFIQEKKKQSPNTVKSAARQWDCEQNK